MAIRTSPALLTKLAKEAIEIFGGKSGRALGTAWLTMCVSEVEDSPVLSNKIPVVVVLSADGVNDLSVFSFNGAHIMYAEATFVACLCIEFTNGHRLRCGDRGRDTFAVVPRAEAYLWDEWEAGHGGPPPRPSVFSKEYIDNPPGYL